MIRKYFWHNFGIVSTEVLGKSKEEVTDIFSKQFQVLKEEMNLDDRELLIEMIKEPEKYRKIYMESSIVKSPQRNNQTGSTFPLPMKRIPPFRLVGKRFYDPNAPPYKAVFRITTDFIWRILLCMKNI